MTAELLGATRVLRGYGSPCAELWGATRSYQTTARDYETTIRGDLPTGPTGI
jgi:hypothetical protein